MIIPNIRENKSHVPVTTNQIQTEFLPKTHAEKLANLASTSGTPEVRRLGLSMSETRECPRQIPNDPASPIQIYHNVPNIDMA